MNQKINIMLHSMTSSFYGDYTSIKNSFYKRGKFKEITNSDIFIRANWPKESGVYVVWNTEKKEEVVYIGMTGKYNNKGGWNHKELGDRFGRYTPYKFYRRPKKFSYGRIVKINGVTKWMTCKLLPIIYVKPKIKKTFVCYAVSILPKNLKVHCFICDKNNNMAPAFLEALLLQAYLIQYGKLPVANNSF